MNRALSVVMLLLAFAHSSFAQETGIITLVEGPLRLIRGVAVMQATEGVRLRTGDILESSDKGFAQLEFNNGAIIALGSASRVFLLGSGTRAAGRQGNASEVVLLSGWLKGQSEGAALHRYDTPLLAAVTSDGSLVFHAGAEAAEVFVESGSAKVGEVSPAGSSRDPRALKSGQFVSRVAGKNLVVDSRPSQSFIDGMPHQFRDRFSALKSRFTGKPPQPKRDHEVSYAEVQGWLTMPASWRRGFVSRFESRLDNPAFRKAVEAHMKDHPEWDPVVHPELYRKEDAAEGTPDHKTVRNPN